MKKNRKMEDNDMFDTLGQSVQQAVQSILPDMEELKDAVSELETRIDHLESRLTQQFEEHFEGIMKALGAP
jgi:predicted  nucleic acid-binding Zn-ribbon protein